jgi:hypothetical protein
MATWFVAPSLLQLADEINKKYGNPLWPTGSIGDGAVGDTSHAARKSDHNPDWNANGVVRAIDIGIEGRNAKEILETVIGDPRVWYVIHNGIIYSRTNGWAPLRYTGSNQHEKHIHVSLQGANGISSDQALKIAMDKSKWFGDKKRTTVTVDLSNIREQFRIAKKIIPGRVQELNSIKVIQRHLNRKYDLDLKVEGKVRESTLRAYRNHEEKTGRSGRPGMPDHQSLKKLFGDHVKIRW